MRVLVLSTVFPNRAQPTFGTFVRQRVRHLAQHCELEAVAPVPWFPGQRWWRGVEQSAVPHQQRDGELVVHHPRVLSVPGVAKALDAALYAASLAPRLRALRRRFPFEVIDAHFGYPDGVAAVLLAQALNCPVAITLRGFELDLVAHAARRAQLAYALRRAHVIAVSSVLARLADDLSGGTRATTVIGNGVDTQLFRRGDRLAARRELGIEAERGVLLSVGNFVEGKGHELAIAQLPGLLRRHPRLLYVAIGNAPANGSRLPAIRAQVRALGIEPQVRCEVAQPHERIASWMQAADIFCLATRREGCCNAILEALACGLPVVSTRVGGNPELVRDDDGTLVPFFDGAAFAAAIDAALCRDWDRAAIAGRAAQRSWQQVGRAHFTALWNAAQAAATGAT